MATETLYADAVLLNSSCLNPENALGNTPDTWTGNTDQTNWNCRWSVADPSLPLTPGATHYIDILVRRSAAGGSDPTVSGDLYNNGVFVKTIIVTTTITGDAAVFRTGPFTTEELNNGNNVEVMVSVTGSTGPTANRRNVQIATITLTAEVSEAAPAVVVTGSGSGLLSLSATGSGSAPLPLTDNPTEAFPGILIPGTSWPGYIAPVMGEGSGSLSLSATGTGDPVSPPPSTAAFSDDFTGANGTPWNPDKWTTAITNQATMTQENGEGVISVPGGTGITHAGQAIATMEQVADGEILASLSYDVSGGTGLMYARFWLRCDGTWVSNVNPGNGYGVEIRTNTSSVYGFKVLNGTATSLGSLSGVAPAGLGKRWVRLRVEGSTMSVKVWDDGTAEPTAWEMEWTGLTELASGVAQVGVRSSSSTTAVNNSYRFDDFTVTDLNPGVVTPTISSRMIGNMSESGATVMTKTADASSVRLKVSTTADLLTAPVFTSPVTPDANGIAKHTVTGLAADTHYYFGVEMDTETLIENGGQFSTFPAPGQTSFRFAFASCNYGDPDTWGRMRARNPLMFFHLGDFFYDDGGDKTADGYRASYDSKLAAVNSGYDGMHHLPVAYLWSDHDFGKEDASHGADTPQTVIDTVHAVYEQYVPYWNKPVPGTIAQTFVIGRVRFIMTDTRTHRSLKSATDDASKTMLGAEQKQWFKDTISSATEPLIVWVQDSVWVAAVQNNTDYWGAYSTERSELAQFINSSGKNLVLLGGDMHALAVDDGTNSEGGITVLQAAAITGGGSHKGGPYSHGPYPAVLPESVRNYAIVDITDLGSTITLDYHGFDKVDAEVLTYSETFNTAVAVSGSGSGSFSVSGTGTGESVSSGSGAGSLSLSASGTGGVVNSGTAAGLASLSAEGAGHVVAAGAGAGEVSLSSTAEGERVSVGSGAASLTVQATGTGGVVNSGTAAALLAVEAASEGFSVPQGSGVGTITVEGTGASTNTLSGEGVASLSLSATATGGVVNSGTAAALLALESEGSGNAVRIGSGTGSVALTATGAASIVAGGQGAGSLSLAATGAGGVVNSGTAAALLGVAATGEGQAVRTGSGAGTLSLTGTGDATLTIRGDGVGTLSLVATGTGGAVNSGTAAALLALSATGTGLLVPTGVAEGSVGLSAASTGQSVAQGAGAGSVALSASGSGVPVTATPTGYGAASLGLSAEGSGHSLSSGAGSASLSLSAQASGGTVLPGSGAGSVSLSGSGAGYRVPTGSGEASVTLTGAGEGVVIVPVDVVVGNGFGYLSLSAGASGGAVPGGSGAALLSPLTGTGTGSKVPTGQALATLELSAQAQGLRILAGLGTANLALVGVDTAERRNISIRLISGPRGNPLIVSSGPRGNPLAVSNPYGRLFPVHGPSLEKMT